MKFLQKHKQPSWEAPLLFILAVISALSLGFMTEGKVAGIAAGAAGNMAEDGGIGMENGL